MEQVRRCAHQHPTTSIDLRAQGRMPSFSVDAWRARDTHQSFQRGMVGLHETRVYMYGCLEALSVLKRSQVSFRLLHMIVLLAHQHIVALQTSCHLLRSAEAGNHLPHSAHDTSVYEPMLLDCYHCLMQQHREHEWRSSRRS